MKKAIIYSAACLLALSSCDLDINDDPSYPSESDITPTLLFPSVQNSLATVPGDAMFTYGGFFAQYFEQKPELNQYNDYCELHFDESTQLFDRCYRTIYAGALNDIKDIEGKTTNTANIFALKVMTALAMQYMTDCCSDAPYTEACQGSANPAPKWDSGESVYKSVLQAMDDAEAAISTSDVMDMTDPMLGKNIEAWKRFANALRLRMYMRLIDGGIDAATYTEKAKAIVAEGNLPTGDVTFDVYSDADGQYNPWYECARSIGSNNFCAAHPIVSYYTTTNDPRISYAMSPASATGQYAGELPGAKAMYTNWGSKKLNKDFSEINLMPAHDMPVYIMTLSEVEFLVAEVELRFNNNEAAAKAAYEIAVESDFASRGMTGAATFLTGSKVDFDAQATAADKLNLIYMQKWVAFFYRNHMEAWSEQRRTDVPKLSSHTAKDIFDNSTVYTPGEMIAPALNYYGNGDICKRIPYPLTARQLNSNTPAVKTLADRVFWDAK